MTPFCDVLKRLLKSHRKMKKINKKKMKDNAVSTYPINVSVMFLLTRDKQRMRSFSF